MNWRWTWLRAQLTAIVASALVWLVALVLSPALVGVVVVVSVVLVAGWRSRLGLRVRLGARQARSDAAELVWRALIPVEWLRGRNQPLLFTSTRLAQDVVAGGPRELVVHERLARRVSEGQLDDADLCRLVVRAMALTEVNRSRLAASVNLFCLPWSLMAIAARTVCRPVRSIRLAGFAWRVRWLFVALAVVDLYQRGHWPGLVMLILVATATITTPRWNLAWSRRQEAMSEAAEQRLARRMDSAGSAGCLPRAGGRPARPVAGSGGAQ
ncbi:hypothetical protein [Micropruina sonneratiae]|uniref:hypothetical protein n=1 Tax=Micropruina sonneratiae TaxID=2986940 RepID=UPI0022268A86|nr:hypothetical protein [Micropruina sp. KQZ13P-5]MCW3159460.1 hypothetical protein [Micropruina sp. KQZ13P-5]